MTDFKPITRNRALVNVNSALKAIIDAAEMLRDNHSFRETEGNLWVMVDSEEFDKLMKALAKL